MNHRARSASSWFRRGLSIFFAILFALSSSGLNLAQARTPAQGRRPHPDRAARLQALADLIRASGQATGSQAAEGLKKMDTQIQNLLETRLRGQDVAAAAKHNGLRLGKERSVLVDVYTRGAPEETADQLKALGMDVLATNTAFGGIVEGYLPVDSLVAAAGLNSTKAFHTVPRPRPDAGPTTSEGDAAMSAPAARLLGVNGAGVKVGIISDSINQVGTKVAGSQASGDLPANVTVLLDDTSADVVDEGRAMAEIVYDTAPGITDMYFSSGTTGGPAVKAASIADLVSHGVDVIVDDVPAIDQPFWQDGVVAQAVDAAYNAGVAYFVSAGNAARQAYEQPWRDGGPSGSEWNAHDFDPGVGTDIYQTIATVPNGDCFEGMLQYAEPWGAATWDLDWWLYDASTEALVTYSAADNGADGLPYEYVYWCNTTGSPVTLEDEIDWWHGDTPPFGPAPVGLLVKYFTNIYGAPTFSIAEWDTSSPTIDPDAASANGAMTVAAVDYSDPGLNDPEDYSSRGPVTRYFNASGVYLGGPQYRQKPQVAGPDCVSTSNNFEGGGSFDPYGFCGTSAAAPAVAGVAALVLDTEPSLTPAQLYATLGNAGNTYDCSAPGIPDNDCGYGFVRADRAVAYALNDGPALSDPWYGGVSVESSRNVVAVGRPHIGAEVASYDGVPAGGLTSYLPMLFKNAFGGSYDSAFYVQNLDADNDAHVTVKYYDAGGNLSCSKLADTIPPLSSHGTWVPSETCLPVGWVGGAVVTSSDYPITVVARPHVGTQVMTYNGFAAGALTSYVPMLFKHSFGGLYDSALYIQNVDPDNAAHVTVKYYDTMGGLTCTKPVDTIPALSSHGTWVPNETCLPVGWVGGAVVTSSDNPVVAVARPHVGAEVTTYDGFAGGGLSAYAPMLFKEAFGGSYNSAFYIQNLNPSNAAHVTVKYYDSSGNLSCTKPVDTIPALSSHGIWVPSETCLSVGWVGGAVVTSADYPIVVVARPHVGAQVTTYDGFASGTAGASLPMLFKHMWGSYDSAFYVQNTDPAGAALVTISLYDVNGNLSCTHSDIIPALATLGFWVPTLRCLP